MVGSAAATQDAIARKTGLKSSYAVARDINAKRKVTGKHAAHMGGWVGTRGVMAAGIPLAAIGAKNLVSPKPKEVSSLNMKRDVVAPTLDRTTSGAVDFTDSNKAPRKARAAELATVTAGSTAGGVGGAAAARRLMRGGGKKRLAAVGLGTAAGAVTGSLASAPFGRRAVQRSTKGKYTYTTEQGVHQVSKTRSDDAAINTLAQNEQRELLRRKKKQTRYSLTSAGLGATALALQTPRLAPLAMRSRHLKNSGALKRVAAVAPKTTNASSTIGIGSLGVGSVGSLNYARINRSETKAEGRSSNAMKQVKKAVEYKHTKRGDLQEIGAYDDGKNIGYLEVRPDSVVNHVKVKRSHRRKGIATAMWEEAERKGLNPQHNPSNQSRSGKAWANSEKVKKLHLHGERDRQVDVAKALLRVPKFPKRPPGFAGVKTGGLRTIRNPYTGMTRQVTVRGSMG